MRQNLGDGGINALTNAAIILVLWSLLLFIVRVWSLTGVKLLGQGGLEKAQA